MIKTVKLSKTSNVGICCVSHDPESNEISYIQTSNYEIMWKSSAIGEEISIEELSYNQNVTLHKIDHFLTNYLDNSVWFEADGIEMSNKALASTENMLIITPTLNFTILGLCLFAKLNSLCKPGIIVTDLSISEKSANQVFEYTDLDAELPESLPNQAEFMGEFSIWENPWWLRDDVTTYDNRTINEEELLRIRENLKEAHDNISSDFEMIEEQVREMFNDAAPAEIIEVDFDKLSKEKHTWKPKLV